MKPPGSWKRVGAVTEGAETAPLPQTADDRDAVGGGRGRVSLPKGAGLLKQANEVSQSLPPGWVWTTVGDVAELLRGVSYDKEVATAARAVGQVPILRATNIQSGHLVLDSDLVYVPQRYVRSEQMLNPGDIVICMSSGSKEHVGKAAQLTVPWEGSFGAFCAALRFDSALDNRFAAYFFESPAYRSLIRSRSTGININNLRRGDIETLVFPLAPLSEQYRIVTEIEKQFARLDAGVATLKQAQVRLRRYKAAVLQAACEGRLVPTAAELARAEGREYEPASVLLERVRARRRVAPGQDRRARNDGGKQRDLDQLLLENALPEGWLSCKLDSVAEVRLGRQRSPQRAFGPHMRPYLRAANVTWDGLDLSDVKEMDFSPDELDTYRLIPGDLLLGEASGSVSEVGKPALWGGEIPDCCFQNTLVRVRSEGPLPSFFLIHFQRDALMGRFSQIAKGVGIHHLGAEGLSNWTVKIPPLAEQQRIVAEVERRLSVVQELEKQIAAALRRAARLRQAILKRAFEGRLASQDPADEPAEVPERIQAERNPHPSSAKLSPKSGRGIQMELFE